MNHPKAIALCMYPRSGLRFQIFTWKRQSQNKSLIFLRAVVGVTSDFQNLTLSECGIFSRSLMQPTVIQQRKKTMPTQKGMTK